uniref:NADH-ubiquinone oxidoreductase chain 6 n=1 Tax=Anaxyrus americanus TaxID=8389 RepID=A0A6G8QTJ7_ANAAE|nr:NADH dehydrogenase subunit 6 [Anaxyrus americanus]QIN90661.1 NADH dehydrogenase subunit 6 [Anaxyrus americanus]
MTVLFELGLIIGLLAVASNPSPYYAALGLVGSAGAGCLILMDGGASFLCLVLFLVYLGGMMVVFAYSAALVAEPYPEAWGGGVVWSYITIYVTLLGIWWVMEGVGEGVMTVGEMGVCVDDWFGVAMMFFWGGGVLMMVGWALLLTLFAVLEVVRGHYSGVLRAV